MNERLYFTMGGNDGLGYGGGGPKHQPPAGITLVPCPVKSKVVDEIIKRQEQKEQLRQIAL